MKAVLIILSLLSCSTADLSSNYQGGRVPGGIDFSGCVNDPDTGYCCIEKEETISSIQKDPILECTHKSVEKCHYTYVTKFSPSQEEVCEENFEKICQITFKQQAFNETVKKCYKPLRKVCNGQGPEECRTLYESSCTTKYIEKQPGKFVGDTGCEKLPIEICGAGCVTEEGSQECHDKVITSIVDIPEEICDLNPQKICKLETKLVPKLTPSHECTTIPQETCQLKLSQAQKVEKPLRTKWCLDESPTAPGETYDENSALGDPRTSFSPDNFVQTQSSNTINEGQQQNIPSFPSSFEKSQNTFSNNVFEQSQTASSPNNFDFQNDFASDSFASSIQRPGSSQNTFGLNQQQPIFEADSFSSNPIDNFGSSQPGSNIGNFEFSQSGSNIGNFGTSQSGSNIEAFGSSQTGSNVDDFGASQSGSNIGNFGSSQSGSNVEAFGSSQSGSNVDDFGSSQSGSNIGNFGSSQSGSNIGNFGSSQAGSNVEDFGSIQSGSNVGNFGSSQSGSNVEAFESSQPGSNVGNFGSTQSGSNVEAFESSQPGSNVGNFGSIQSGSNVEAFGSSQSGSNVGNFGSSQTGSNVEAFGSSQSGSNVGNFGSSQSGSNVEAFGSSEPGSNIGNFGSSQPGFNSEDFGSSQSGSNVGGFGSSQTEAFFPQDQDFLFADSFESTQPSQFDGNTLETHASQPSFSSNTFESNKVETVFSPSTFESTPSQSSFTPNTFESNKQFGFDQSQSQFPQESEPLFQTQEQSSFTTFESEPSPFNDDSFGILDESRQLGLATDSFVSSQSPSFGGNNFGTSQLQSPYAADTYVSNQESFGSDSFGLKEQRPYFASNPIDASFIREESTFPGSFESNSIFQSRKSFNPQGSSFEDTEFSSNPTYDRQPNVFDPKLVNYRRF